MTERNKIFVSYRREDSPSETGRIYDRLTAQFGAQAVFKDVDDIPFGVNFKDYLDNVIQECVVLLVVIGPRWLDITDNSGRRRLDRASDFVRIEVEAALRRDIPVIPLLVGNASIPGENELPPNLRELAYRNGIEIRHDPDFHKDMDRLIRGIQDLFEMEPSYPEPEPEPSPIPQTTPAPGGTFQQVKTILEELFFVDGDLVSPGARLMDDLDLDEIDIIELVLDLEERYNAEITDDDADSFQTVGDVVSYLDTYLT